MMTTPLENRIREVTGARNRQTLGDYQLSKFRETLAYAKKHSRFYRGCLSKTDPDSIRDSGDVRRVPFTTSEELAENPLDFVCVPPGEIGRIVTLPTSGTAGSSKRVFFTTDDQELTVDFFCSGMSALAGKNDRVLIFLPGKSEGSIGGLLVRALERIGCAGILHGPILDYTGACNAMRSHDADCAVGLPSQLFALSRLCTDIKLKSVLLCSDYIAASLKRAIESAWGAEVFSHYGMIESGLGGGVDCGAHLGYHMREADLLFEIVDPATGEPVPDGTQGEIVFTTLTRRGMPLVRYRTGDLSCVIPDPCPCGSFLRRLGHVSGRICDQASTGVASNVSISALDEVLFGTPGLIGYTAGIVRGAGRDILTITVHADDCGSAIREAESRVSDDPRLSGSLKQGLLSIEFRKGGPEALTYGNTKRAIIRTGIKVATPRLECGVWSVECEV